MYLLIIYPLAPSVKADSYQPGWRTLTARNQWLYMLSFFRMYSPLWSQCKQGVHADHFYKENTKATSGHFQNENSEFFHNYDHNVSSGYFLKETPGFFHNHVYNVTTMHLSHSLRFLSKYIQECNQNIPSRFYSK